MATRPRKSPPSHLNNAQPPGRLLCVAGPTGVGKSAFAIELARRLDAEIIGADAFQIYREIPILTAQPTPAQLASVNHHLIGFHPVSLAFDAAEYSALAKQVLDDIWRRGKTVLLVGGTGLYFRAILTGFDSLPPSDPQLRAQLAPLSLDDLVEKLASLDPDAVHQIDVKNPRRVMRAIEICATSGQPLATFRSQLTRPKPSNGLILFRNRMELHARIEGNVDRLFESGVADEVDGIGEIGPTAAQTLGLREVQDFCAGEIDRSEAARRIVVATRQYAKRQLTWFRNQTSFRSLDLTGTSQPSDAVERAMVMLCA